MLKILRIGQLLLGFIVQLNSYQLIFNWMGSKSTLTKNQPMMFCKDFGAIVGGGIEANAAGIVELVRNHYSLPMNYASQHMRQS